jgi:hypothetical protein
MSLGELLLQCDAALQRLTELLRKPWHSAGAIDLYSSGPSLTSTCQEVKKLLRGLVEVGVIQAPLESEPPVTMAQVQDLQDVPTAIGLVKRLRHWGDSLVAKEPMILHVHDDERGQGGQQHGKAKAMRSAARETEEESEPAEPLPQPRYPVEAVVSSFAPEAMDQLRSIRQPDPSVALTDEDRYLLTVLDASRGKALSFSKIATESVRMEREDRTKVRRLSDSTIRQRVPVLITQGLVVRPAGTKRQGISITDEGHDALSLARGNPTETQRKS